jgi:hypothetical protein
MYANPIESFPTQLLRLSTFTSRYFLEEDAVDSQGKLTREKQKAVNKIGHGTLDLHL